MNSRILIPGFKAGHELPSPHQTHLSPDPTCPSTQWQFPKFTGCSLASKLLYGSCSLTWDSQLHPLAASQFLMSPGPCLSASSPRRPSLLFPLCCLGPRHLCSTPQTPGLPTSVLGTEQCDCVCDLLLYPHLSVSPLGQSLRGPISSFSGRLTPTWIIPKRHSPCTCLWQAVVGRTLGQSLSYQTETVGTAACGEFNLKRIYLGKYCQRHFLQISYEA